MVDKNHGLRIVDSSFRSEGAVTPPSRCQLTAMVVCDSQGRILYWDDACQEIFGWSRASILNTRIHDVLFVRVTEDMLDDLLQAGCRQDTSQRWELQAVAQDGKPLILEGRLPLLKSHEGPNVALLFVPEQKESAGLGAPDNHSSGYLPASTMRGFVHDLSNLLTGIMGYVSLLMWSKDDALSPQVRGYVSVIEETTLRALSLITRIGEVTAAAQEAEHKDNPQS
jgi:PAS domain S-box-containing protein